MDPEGAEVVPRERAIVDYAIELTRLSLNDTVSYFSYANRLADGLGVKLEEDRWDPVAD